MKFLATLSIVFILTGCQSHREPTGNLREPTGNVMYPEADAKELCPQEGNASRIK